MATPKVRDVIRRPLDDGWYHVNTEGDHRHYKHPTKPGKVTVSGKSNVNVPEGTWKRIQRQAGWIE